MKAFEDFSRDELEHARMLIRYILNKEGKPVFIMPEVNQEQDEIKLLVLSMASEESAVKKHTMIQQLIDDPSDKEMFGRTIEVERQQYEILKGIMEKLKEVYKFPYKPAI